MNKRLCDVRAFQINILNFLRSNIFTLKEILIAKSNKEVRYVFEKALHPLTQHSHEPNEEK